MSQEIIKARSWTQLDTKEKKDITMEFLQNPEMTDKEIANKHHATLAVVKRLKDIMSFDEDTATGAVILRAMRKDVEVLEKTAEINMRYANDVSKKRTLASKDIETLDKVSNTIMKRQMLVDKMRKEEDGEQGAPIILTF